MDRIRRRLALIVIAVGVILTFGTIGFIVVEDYPPFDAFYMTLTTVTTVGYGEIRTLSRAGRMFNTVLIMSGVTVIFLAVGAMTQTAIELEFTQYFGKRRVKNMINKLENHIILCGFGRVGRGAAAELRDAGIPFVVVDRSEERVERAIHAGMLAVLADASRDETLRDVGIDRAKGLIATLASDADNLFLVLTAKTLNANLQLASRVSEESAEQKMRRAGANYVFAPYNTTGHRMAQAMIKPHVLQFLDLTTQRNMGLDIGIEQVRVDDNCTYCHKTLAQMQATQQTGVIVLAIRDAAGAMRFNPPPDARIEPGDHLIVMGQPHDLSRLERILEGSVA